VPVRVFNVQDGGTMKSTLSLRLQDAIVGLAFAIASVGCATVEQPKAERYVAPPLGSTWVNERRDTGSYGTASIRAPGKRGEQTWQGNQHVTFEGPEGAIMARPDGAWVGVFRDGKPILTWDPPASYEWPLVVGKTFTQSYRLTNHVTQRTQAFDSTSSVEAYEDVSVPAGTFKAFRVKSSDTLGNENITWFSPALGIFVKQSMRRTDKHAQGPGTREIELVEQNIKK